MFIVVYRPHNQLIAETQYIGPFADYRAAEDMLIKLGPLGPHISAGFHATPNKGVKFIQELQPPRFI